MPALVAGIHVFLFDLSAKENVDGTATRGLPELRVERVASRINPTCADKPGHDGLGGSERACMPCGNNVAPRDLT
jgi:hypothetical protein